MEGQRGYVPRPRSQLSVGIATVAAPSSGWGWGRAGNARSLRTPGSIVASQFSEENVGSPKAHLTTRRNLPHSPKNLDCKFCASITGYSASGVRGYENPLCSLNLKDSRNSPPPHLPPVYPLASISKFKDYKQVPLCLT